MTRQPRSARWPDSEVRRLLDHAAQRIAAATAKVWPGAEATFGPTVTGGSSLLRQVQVDGETLCATVSPAGAALSSVVRGDHGDLAAALSGDSDGLRPDTTVREAEQLMALAAYSRLRVAAPTALEKGVMFTPWVTGTRLTGRLQARPAALTELLTSLMDDLADLHHDPADPLRQVAAPTTSRTLPRVVTDALGTSAEHLYPHVGEVGEVKALARSLSVRLGRLASQLDPVLFARAGVAYGNLTPDHVLYPGDSLRGVLVSPSLGPGGEPADTGVLLGHLHLMALGCPPPVRADLVEGVEAWLAGRLAARRGEWRGWLAAVLTTWAATVYDTVVGGLRLPVDALPLDPTRAGFLRQSLPALAVLDVLTRTLRRRSADAALNAALSALADPPEPAGSAPAGTTADS